MKPEPVSPKTSFLLDLEDPGWTQEVTCGCSLLLIPSLPTASVNNQPIDESIILL